MVVDERSRHELYRRLEQTLGEEAAATLMEHLPPVGWADVATRRDLDVLRSDLRAEMADLRGDLRGEMAGLRTDMAGLRTDMADLRGDFRGEITAALTSQTRVIMFTMLGAIVAHGGLVLAVVRLG